MRDGDPQLSAVLREVAAAKMAPSRDAMDRIGHVLAQAVKSNAGIPEALLSVALSAALPLLSSRDDDDNTGALDLIHILLDAVPESPPLSFWPTCLGALSAASRRLPSERIRSRSIQQLARLLVPPIFKQLSDSTFAKPLAHIAGALLDAAQRESLRSLRILALNALGSLCAGLEHDALTAMAPGLISGLAGIAAADFKIGSGVIRASIDALGDCLANAIGTASADDEICTRSSLLVGAVIRRRLEQSAEPSLTVSRALVSLCRRALSLPLTGCRPAMVDVILAFAECDDDRQVAIAVDTQGILRRLNASVGGTSSTIRAASSAIRLAPSTSIDSLWASDRDALVRVLSRLVRVSDDESAVTALERGPVPFYNIALFDDDADARLDVVRSLAGSATARTAEEMALTCLAFEPASVERYLLVSLIMQGARSSPNDRIINSLLDDPLWSEEWHEGDKSAGRRAALLRCVANAAERCGRSFGAHLIRALFPVLNCLAMPSVIVRQAAVATLHRLAIATDAGNVMGLLIANADYLVDVMCARLMEGGVHALTTSMMLEAIFGGSASQLRLCSADESGQDADPGANLFVELAALLDDVIRTVLDALDDERCTGALALSHLRVLLRAVQSLSADALVPSPPGRQDTAPGAADVDDGGHFSLGSMRQRLLALSSDLRRRLDNDKRFFSDDVPLCPPEGIDNVDLEDDGVDGLPHGNVDHDQSDGDNAAEQQEQAGPVPNLIAMILSRAQHFLESEDLARRHVVLQLVAACLRGLAPYSTLLLPQVATFWDALKIGFSNSDRAVLSKSLDAAEVIVDVCPEFIARRVSDDLWPAIRRMMIRELRASSTHFAATPAAVAMQVRSLRLLQSCLRRPPAMMMIINDIANHCWPYLNEGLPIDLQVAARDLFCLLGELDPDMAWWTLARIVIAAGGELGGPAPNALCIPVQSQVVVQQPKTERSCRRNAEWLLSRLASAPEIQFDDYVN
ncbi:TATA-binding protein interacting (TIP20) domain-containing protein [Plasmodiophora brassicae]